MNTKLVYLVAVYAALWQTHALAQEATPEPVAAVSSLTRAEVRAELERASKNGEMKVFRTGYIGEVAVSRSRAEVIVELQRARASGEWAAINAEVHEPVARPHPAAPLVAQERP